MGRPVAGRQPPPPPIILSLAGGARWGQGLSKRTEATSYKRGFSPPQQGPWNIRLNDNMCRNSGREQEQRDASREGFRGLPQPPFIQRQPQTRSGPSTSSAREAAIPLNPLRHSKKPAAEGPYPFTEYDRQNYPVSVAPQGPLGYARNHPPPYRDQGPAPSSLHEGNMRGRLCLYETSWGEVPFERQGALDKASNCSPATAWRQPPPPPRRTLMPMFARAPSTSLVFPQSRRRSGEASPSASYGTVEVLRSHMPPQDFRCEQQGEELLPLVLKSGSKSSQSPFKDGLRHASQESGPLVVTIESSEGDLSVERCNNSSECINSSSSNRISSGNSNTSNVSNSSSSSRTSFNCGSTRGGAGSISRSGSESSNADSDSDLGSPYAQRDACAKGPRPLPPLSRDAHDSKRDALVIHVIRTIPIDDDSERRIDSVKSDACISARQSARERHNQPPSSNRLRNQEIQHPPAFPSRGSSCHSHSGNTSSSSSRVSDTWLKSLAGVDKSSSSSSTCSSSTCSGSSTTRSGLKREDGTARPCAQPQDAPPPAAGASADSPFNKRTRDQQGLQQQRDALEEEQEKPHPQSLRQLHRQLELLQCRTQQDHDASEPSRQQRGLPQNELQQHLIQQREEPQQQQAQEQHQPPLPGKTRSEAIKLELLGSHHDCAQALQQQDLPLQGSSQQQPHLNLQVEHQQPRADQQPLPPLLGCKHEGVATIANAAAADVKSDSRGSGAPQQAFLAGAGLGHGGSKPVLREPLPVQQELRHPELSTSLQGQANPTRMQQQRLSRSVTGQQKEQQRERRHQQHQHRQRQLQKQEQLDPPQRHTQQQPEDSDQRRASPPLRDEQQQMQQETRNRKRRLANLQKPRCKILEPSQQIHQTQLQQSVLSSSGQDSSKCLAPEATRDQQQPIQDTLQRQQHQRHLWQPHQNITPPLTQQQQALVQLPQRLQHLELRALLQPRALVFSTNGRPLRGLESLTPSGKVDVAAASIAARASPQDLYSCCNHLFLPAASGFGLSAADAFYQYEADPPVAGGAASGAAAAVSDAFGAPAAICASAVARIHSREEQDQRPATRQLIGVKREQQQRQRLRERGACVLLHHGRPVEAASADPLRVSDIAAEPGLTAAVGKLPATAANAAAVAAARAADGAAPQTGANSQGHPTVPSRSCRPAVLEQRLVELDHQQQLASQHQEPQEQTERNKQLQPHQQRHLHDQQQQQERDRIEEQHIERLSQEAQEHDSDLRETLRLLRSEEERDARLQRVEACKQPRQHRRLLLLLQEKALLLRQQRAKALQEMQQLVSARQRDHRMP
ncbi:hypothetical protein ACSSS7_004276 [Eimeria intestinalis]